MPISLSRHIKILLIGLLKRDSIRTLYNLLYPPLMYFNVPTVPCGPRPGRLYQTCHCWISTLESSQLSMSPTTHLSVWLIAAPQWIWSQPAYWGWFLQQEVLASDTLAVSAHPDGYGKQSKTKYQWWFMTAKHQGQLYTSIDPIQSWIPGPVMRAEKHSHLTRAFCQSWHRRWGALRWMGR